MEFAAGVAQETDHYQGHNPQQQGHYHIRNPHEHTNSENEAGLEQSLTRQTTVDADGNPLLYDEHGKIRLMPAPTDDPRDPLNLPMTRKCIAIFSLCVFGAMAAAAEIILGAMLPVFVLVYANIDVRWIVVVTTFHGLKGDPLAMLNEIGSVPIWQIYLLASLPVLMMGASNFFLVPLAIAIGRRFVILVCGVLALVGAIWAGCSQSLGSHLGARCLQALGAGTVESLIPFILQDMVFVHQRNSAISVVFAIQGLLIVGLGIATPYIIIYLSWRWVYFITVIVAGVFLILVFFFVPETRWHRTADEMAGIPRPLNAYRSDSSPASSQTKVGGDEKHATRAKYNSYNPAPAQPVPVPNTKAGKMWTGFLSTTKFGEKYVEQDPNDPEYIYRMEREERRARRRQEKYEANMGGYPKRTWAYDLALWHGKIHWRAGWKALLATIYTFFYPQIFFITMLNSAMIAAALAAGYTVSPALLTDPYNWSFFHIGLCLIPVVIAAIFVAGFTGFFADWFANYMAKRKGHRVPEAQIINLIVPTICALVGSVLFGVAGSDPYKYPWPVFLFALGLMAFGFLGANTIGAVYVLESYPHLAG